MDAMELLIIFDDEELFQRYAITFLLCWNTEVSQDDLDAVIESTIL